MRLHRFFIEDHLRNKKDIDIYDDELIHQWKDVFRLRVGDKVILLDNTGFEYLAQVSLLAKGNASFSILECNANENVSEKEVWLYASLVKKNNFEWILEKCTELGVSHFVPVISDRSEKKDLNIERGQKIIKEASEQSGRGLLPELHDVLLLNEAIEQTREQNLNPQAFHLSGQEFSYEKIFGQKLGTHNKVSLFIGPEGGWSDKEVELFRSKDIPLYKLGHQVLRAETAAIAVSSLLLLK